MTSALPPAPPSPTDPGQQPPPPPPPGPAPHTQLRRSRTDKMIGGVAGGLAEYSGVEAQVELPDPSPGGQVLLACAQRDVDRLGTKNVVRIGTVHG